MIRLQRYGAALAPLALLALGVASAAPPRAVRSRSGAPAAASSTRAAADKVRFNRDIRPILSESCFTCHGPDAAKRMAGLRLDLRESALAHGVLAPGKPEKSTLLQRVLSGDPALQMPPPDSRKHLTDVQKALMKRWIAEGAVYERHWAFTPLPHSVPLPSVHSTAWCRDPIDRFILARLEQEKIKPSAEASRAEWLRRVSLDLTGLPPTLSEIDAFVGDSSPKAYERVADRLLVSPHFGEQMALPWLDVARCADSYGYQSDQLCPTWPYRDWVVRAFNQNLPYNRFITDQIAGDLLPSPTTDERLATAFNRLHRMTNEGGSVPEEWRQEGVADRVRTLGTAFLGVTLECARCHDHKFDPVSQREFYSLAAFFNSIDEHGLYDRADIIPAPSLLLPTSTQAKELSDARESVATAEHDLARARTRREPAFRAWRDSPENPARSLSPAILPDEIGHFDFTEADGTELKNRAPNAAFDGIRQDDVKPVDGPNGQPGRAIQFDGESNISFPKANLLGRHTPFTVAFWLRDSRYAPESVVVFHGTSGTDAGPHGYDLLLNQGRFTARLFRHWPGNAIAVQTRQPIPRDTWTHVAVTYDGSSRAAGLQISLNGVAAETEVVRDHLYKGIGQSPLVFGQRMRDHGFQQGRIGNLYLFARALSPLEVTLLAQGDTAPVPGTQPDAELRAYYLSAIDPETRATAQQLQTVRQRLVAAEDTCLEVAIMEEMPHPRPTYVLARGQYDAPVTDADRVMRETPAAILPFSPNLRRDRLGLAQWLTRSDNPLTARVAVNRFWAILFGRGLVETTEDFGSQGRLPSHPELLDSLAIDFQRSGWNVKGLLRRIVLSQAYRQRSALRPDLRLRDPQNILLARGPSGRLSAETIRDVALAASGLLDTRLGGPPVSPYQPGDLWRESNAMSPPYRQSAGADLYRRSLYTVRKRTAPIPNLTVFDTPSREVCTARRSVTNTPLQALVLLNDTQFVEAARVLAEHMLKEGGATESSRVRFAFRRLATRGPTADEMVILTRLYREQHELYHAHPEEADRLIHIGDSKPDPALSPETLAAATVVAQAILNLDATIWKR